MLKILLKKINKDIHLKELLEGSFTALFLRVLGIGVGYLFVLLVTRIYGAKVMGIFALSLTLIQIFSTVGKLGTDITLVRFIAEFNSQKKYKLIAEIYLKVLRLIIPISLFLSIILFFSSSFIASYIFNKPYLSDFFRIVSIAIVPFVVLTINAQSLRGFKKIKEFTFFQSISNYLIAFLLLIIFSLSWKNDFIPIATYIISIFISFMLSSLLIKNQFKSITSENNDFNEKNSISLQQILSIALPMFFTSSLALIMNWADILMLGIFLTEKDVGVYNVVTKISTLTAITLAAINTIAAPKFAEFFGKNELKQLEKTVKQSTKLIFWTSFPILLILAIFPIQILSIFGSEFKEGDLALRILIFGQFINAISGSVVFLLNMTGKEKAARNIIAIGVTLNIILNLVLIPLYGINGAAFASMISVSFINLTSVFYIKNKYGFLTLYFPLVKYK